MWNYKNGIGLLGSEAQTRKGVRGRWTMCARLSSGGGCVLVLGSWRVDSSEWRKSRWLTWNKNKNSSGKLPLSESLFWKEERCLRPSAVRFPRRFLFIFILGITSFLGYKELQRTPALLLPRCCVFLQLELCNSPYDVPQLMSVTCSSWFAPYWLT